MPTSFDRVTEDQEALALSAVYCFNARREQNLPTVIVFYRGEKSYFCRAWIERWLSTPALNRRLTLARASIFFVSAQSQGKAYSLAEQLGIDTINSPETSICFFGDPQHELIKRLDEVGLTTPFITGHQGSYRAHGWFYDRGMVQPAVIACMGDQELFDWVLKPSLRNGGGKLKRQDPWEIWDYIERKLDRVRFDKIKHDRDVTGTIKSKADASNAVPGAAMGVVKSATSKNSEGADEGVAKAVESDTSTPTVKKSVTQQNGAVEGEDRRAADAQETLTTITTTTSSVVPVGGEAPSSPQVDADSSYVKTPNESPLNPDTLTSTDAEMLASSRAPAQDSSKMMSVPPRQVPSGLESGSAAGGEEQTSAVGEPVAPVSVIEGTNSQVKPISKKQHLRDVSTTAVMDEPVPMPHVLPAGAERAGDLSTPIAEDSEVVNPAIFENDEPISTEKPDTRSTGMPLDIVEDSNGTDSQNAALPTSAITPTEPSKAILGKTDASSGGKGGSTLASSDAKLPEIPSAASGPPRTSAGVLIHSISDDGDSQRKATRRSIAQELDEAEADNDVLLTTSTVSKTDTLEPRTTAEPFTAASEKAIGDTVEKTGGLTQPIVGLRTAMTESAVPEPSTESDIVGTGMSNVEKRRSLTFASEPEILPEDGAGDFVGESGMPDVAATPPAGASREGRPGSTISSYSSVRAPDEVGEELYTGEEIKDEYEDLADPVVDEYDTTSRGRTSAMLTGKTGAGLVDQSKALPVLAGTNAVREDSSSSRGDARGVYEKYDGFEEVVAEEIPEEDTAEEETPATFMQEGDKYADADVREVDEAMIREKPTVVVHEEQVTEQIVPVATKPSPSAFTTDKRSDMPLTDTKEGGLEQENVELVKKHEDKPVVPPNATLAERRSIEADMENEEDERTPGIAPRSGPLQTVKNAGRKVAWFWGLDKFLADKGRTEGGKDDGAVRRTASSNGPKTKSISSKLPRRNTFGAAFNKISRRQSSVDDTAKFGSTGRPAAPHSPSSVRDLDDDNRMTDELDATRVKQNSGLMGRLSGRLGRGSQSSSTGTEERGSRRSSLASKVASPGKAVLSKLSVSYGDGAKSDRQSFNESLTRSSDYDPETTEPNMDTAPSPSPQKRSWMSAIPKRRSSGVPNEDSGMEHRAFRHGRADSEDIEEARGGDHGGRGITEMDTGDDDAANVKRKNTMQLLKDGGKKFAWFWGLDVGKKNPEERANGGMTRSGKDRRSSTNGREGMGKFLRLKRNKSEVTKRTRIVSSGSGTAKVGRMRSLFGRSSM